MRKIFALVLVFLTVTHLGPTAMAAESPKSQITEMPAGASIAVQLKSKQTLRGARGEVSDSGFTLVYPSAGDRQIAFDDVTSVKQVGKESHTMRNTLIIVGIAAVGVVAALALHTKACGPFGCQ